MKIRITYIRFLICLISLKGFAFPSEAGLPQGFPISALQDSYNESYELLTDRKMYAVGEKILFSAFNTSAAAIRNACWSRVIYVHLIKPDGSSVTKGKFPLECHGASGYLSVPDDILTGHYYLCAYTKWMRNFSPALFAYVPVTIINPFSPQLEQSNPPPEDRGYPPDAIYQDKVHGSSDNLLSQKLECQSDKAIYRPGEEIQISVQYSGALRAPGGHICLTVAKPGALDTLVQHEIHPIVYASWEKPEPGYLPEIKGLSVSGRLLTGGVSGGLEDARVEMSIFGKQPKLMAYKTNPDGSFYFSLYSFSGSRDMFITARHSAQTEPELLIDNDFASPQISFPTEPFTLSEQERKTAREIILNMQLEKLYRPPGRPDKPGHMTVVNPSTHGIEVRKVWIDDFIELPNLKEVFIELVPEVMPKTRKGRNYLSFLGNEMTRDIMSQFDPLILIDQVPVYDLDKLLALSPGKIRSIEVINELYVIGNSSYGGLINIISKNQDMGGIDLPEHSLFFNYKGFENPIIYNVESETKTAGKTDPGFRNCLFWEPDLRIEPEQTRKLSFHSTDQPGVYLVLVRGVAEDGSILSGKCSFRIEP